jgi:RNase P subunit RPR2
MLTMETDDSVKRKWCPLCHEWKTATVMVAQLKDSELVETTRDLIYCPQCGAMLREDPNKKPQTGG